MFSKSLVLLGLLLPFQGGNDEPYCGKTAEDFSMPATDCEDQDIEFWQALCLQSCFDTYVDSVLFAFEEACDAQNIVDEAHGTCEHFARLDYFICMGDAQTPEEENQCLLDLMDDLEVCNNAYLDASSQISGDLQLDVLDALDDFGTCASWCCEE
jgi:hypothetical protein